MAGGQAIERGKKESCGDTDATDQEGLTFKLPLLTLALYRRTRARLDPVRTILIYL